MASWLNVDFNARKCASTETCACTWAHMSTSVLAPDGLFKQESFTRMLLGAL